MMHVRSKDLPGGYVLNHSPRRDGFVASEPLAFPGKDLEDGSVVSVRDPLWQAMCLMCSEPAPVKRRGLDGMASPLASPSKIERRPARDSDGGVDVTYVPGRGALTAKLYEQLKDKSERLKRNENLTPRDRVDQLLNDPTSSTPAMLIGISMLVLIVLSTFTFVLETAPWFYQEKPPLDGAFFIIESICVCIFTVEFGARLGVCRDRKAFWNNSLNVIDFIAILPYWLDLIARGVNIPGLSVLRVTRLARVFRLLKMSKDNMMLLVQTMSKSAKALNILVFLFVVALIIYSAVLYYAERGSYDLTMLKWMRTVGWNCAYKCTAESMKLISPFLDCTNEGDTNTMFISRFTHGQYADICERVTEESPFQSIPHAVWWAIVTMATVGYGDIYPRTVAGFVLASITMLCGILVIALPVTVIGQNFSTIYSALEKRPRGLGEEVAPTRSVYPRRLHSENSGVTQKPITKHWLDDLAQPWDIDVMYREFLPCRPPVKTAAADVGPSLQRINSKDEMNAFLSGQDLVVAARPKVAGPRYVVAKQSTRAMQEDRRESLEIFAKGSLKVAERKVDVQARLRQLPGFKQFRRMMTKTPPSSPMKTEDNEGEATAPASST